MPEIDADPDLLDLAADKLSRIGSEIGQVAGNVSKVHSELPQGWRSSYSGEFAAELAKQTKSIKSSASTARSLAGQLRKIAAEIRRLEKDLASR